MDSGYGICVFMHLILVMISLNTELYGKAYLPINGCILNWMHLIISQIQFDWTLKRNGYHGAVSISIQYSSE